MQCVCLSVCHSGRKYAYVQYYMRPGETFRERYRKFFERELIRSPIHDEIDINAILGTCCVLDLPTYCTVCHVCLSDSYSNTA